MILRARGVQCICSACQDPAITAELELAFELDRSIIELGSLGRVGQQSGLGNPLSHYMTNSKHQIGRIRESTMTSDCHYTKVVFSQARFEVHVLRTRMPSDSLAAKK